ncbi:glycosyltransferase family 4 protein [Sphingomonas lenta]|uniref:Uncharacterized protein n=1 Tax=Sphingomonas lenta TaxID=1141887 RepID=A0A2A2SAX2_9SPHN|nr:glycosyltransferase family 1 protein [Sphingomonas lenta]PAX06330.1 hypothetical protein CKY28_17760 [Sphingomonas lenta]
MTGTQRQAIHDPSSTPLAVIGFRGVPRVIGGVETHCEHLYPELAAAAPDLEVTLIGRRRYMDPHRDRLGPARCVALPSPPQDALETLLHTPLAVLYARWRLRAAIVHLHGIGPGFFAPLARLLGMRAVVTHHASDFQRPKWGRAARTFLRLGERFAARFADRVVCVSAALEAEFLGRYPDAAERTVVIRHGLAPTDAEAGRAFLAAHGLVHGGYLLAVGRLDATKRFEDLIAAHARAGEGALPLVIVGSSIGDRRYEEHLHATAGPGVRFLGFRAGDELSALYAHAALVLQASEMEGFGLVVLEALAAGAPVALSDLSAHREFGLPPERYFPVGDTDSIADVIAATGPREGPWPAAAPIAARYDPAAAVEAHLRIFRQLANRSNAAQ